jgi:phage terminase large subunit GpA-like protein
VYNYAKTRAGHRVFAIKGVGGEGKPIVGRPSRNNIGKIPLYPIGVDTAKEVHYSRLRIEEPGGGYCHFQAKRDDEYFRQLTAEKQVVRYHKGYPTRAWIKTRTRNEALDVRVYAIAAFHILNINIDSIVKRFHATINRKAEALSGHEEVKPHPLATKKGPKRGGFANNWR